MMSGDQSTERDHITGPNKPNKLGRPAQRVIPGPGLEGETFAWGRWGLYVLPQDMAAYSALRTAALTTQRLGWRPFAQAIGSKDHPVDKERLRPFYDFLEHWGFIACPEQGSLVPRAVIVYPIPDDPSTREVAILEARRLRREGPAAYEVTAFLNFYRQEWEKRHDILFERKPYHRRLAAACLRIHPQQRTLERLVRHFFQYMNGPKTLGAFRKRIDEIAVSADEMRQSRL